MNDAASRAFKSICVVTADPMKVLSVVSEFFPLAKTGGLADVAGSLPEALEPLGIEVATLMPAYRHLRPLLPEALHVGHMDDLLGHKGSVYLLRRPGPSVFLLDIPELFDRDGGLYQNGDRQDFHDNWLRFAVLSLAGACITSTGDIFDADVVHVHDWQSALLPVYLKYRLDCPRPVLLTIHNLAYQGQFDFSIRPYLGLPDEAFSTDCLEYYGGIGYLKGGIVASDAINTVSPTYAREIVTSEAGMGMDGVLRERRADLHGVVNGIDALTWGPEGDPRLPAPYSHRSLTRRRINRVALLSAFGLKDLGGPLFAVLSRLVWQKGLDMLANVADEIFGHGGQLIVLGQGDPSIESALSTKAARNPDKMAVRIEYDEPTAHLVLGGADILLQPSRFEPCGLTHLYALRYGVIPLVSRTGGLSETIIDANDAARFRDVATGFQFHPIDEDNLRVTIARACEAYRDRTGWKLLQREAMKADFSWARSATRYAELYHSLANTSAIGSPVTGTRETARSR